jgi:anti-anti-sigma regulatory factor
MVAPLSWTIRMDEGSAVVAVSGHFAMAGTSDLRTALLKCLADNPESLMVDLSAVELGDETALALFTAVGRQAARWPGTPLLLCAPPPAIAVLVERGRYGRIPVHTTVAQAHRAVTDGRVAVPSISDELLPVAGAVRHARNLVTEACAAWDMPDLVGPASLVISELVSNAVEHAGTMMTVKLARRSRYFHLAVRDGAAQPPAPAPEPRGLAMRGRGLMLVSHVATHWGWLPTVDGKVVWATLVA